MFSDSLLLYGNDTEDTENEILKNLQQLYLKLGNVGLLLRGAIVKGRLQYGPRLTLQNFEKMLPRGDVLARAVGLEKSYKGARLLIENPLAEHILCDSEAWLTPEGYQQKIRYDISEDSPRRRVCPTPDSRAYEMLYFWQSRATRQQSHLLEEELDLDAWKEKLTQTRNMVSSEIRQHYIETLDLIERCEARRQFTERNWRARHQE